MNQLMITLLMTFLRLENQNNSSSCIRKLKLDDDRVTTDPAEILDQLKLFYSDLLDPNKLKLLIPEILDS